MLLYSTVLGISSGMTKEDFVKLVIKWNQTRTIKEDVIPDIQWDGSYSARYGDDYQWLAIQEFEKREIVAVRYEKADPDGSVWDTDIVMNFEFYRMSVRMEMNNNHKDRFYITMFMVPDFITLLEENGYIKDDGILPVTSTPIYISDENDSLISDVINGKDVFGKPVVYVYRISCENDPVDVCQLADRLKGAAHVLVLKGVSTDRTLREIYGRKKSHCGAVDIYYPFKTHARESMIYNEDEEHYSLLMEDVIRRVFEFTNSRKIDPLYTWQGVSAAVLKIKLDAERETEKIRTRIARRQRGRSVIAMLKFQEVEKELDRVKILMEQDEAAKLVESPEDKIRNLHKQIDDLNRANELLQKEIQRLKDKLNLMNSIPILSMGDTLELYPGEVNDLVLLVLPDPYIGRKSRFGAFEMIRDNILDPDDDYPKKERSKMTGNPGVTKQIKQELGEMGFKVLTDDRYYLFEYHDDDCKEIIIKKIPAR